MQAGAPNLLVFREGRRRVRVLDLKLALMREIESLGNGSSFDMDKVTGGLLRAGELECAAADAGNLPVEPYMMVTGRLAESLVAKRLTFTQGSLAGAVAAAAAPGEAGEVEVAPAEGFAYYALHPLAYAEAADKISTSAPSVLVIGIRSIGTTLSAITAAALELRGTKASRITVRPGGPPYNRKTRFSPAECELIRRRLAVNAAFCIVDEGPGLSGSSFLSVAESLVEAGVAPARVMIVCARQPDFDSLCADNGPQRARRFRWLAVSSQPRKPAGAEIFVGGGEWRRHTFPECTPWPASWISFERLKYLSSNHDQRASIRLFKFAGLGHYGERVLDREASVAAGGFGPVPQRETEGFTSCQWIAGRAMSAADLSSDTIERLAAYCAFRLRSFSGKCSGLSALEHMAQHNIRQLGLAIPICLRVERPVLCDGRMQPHEWLQTRQGAILKTDSGGHGDDHFFPGVTDIAWDLAGAIVEWRMNAAAAEAFLAHYRRASGDDASSRVHDFIAAYAAFRSAYCTMAAHALKGSPEQARLERAAEEYRTALAARC